jgi:hypothetical protein
VGAVTAGGLVQVTVGGVTSEILTVKVHVVVLDEASTAVYVTNVMPLKVEPEACETDWILAPEQLSVGVGVVQLAVLPHDVVSALAVTVEGQVIDGACVSLITTLKEHVAVLDDPSTAV